MTGYVIVVILTKDSKLKVVFDVAIILVCGSIGNELSDIIKRLKRSGKAFSKALDLWRISISRLRKEKRIGILRERLMRLHQLLSMQIEHELDE